MGSFLPSVCFFLVGFPEMLRPSSAALAGFFDGVNAIYSFGDSFSDTGNLIREVNNSLFFAISRLPYGETTLPIFRKPTGRASDGLLIIGYYGTLFLLGEIVFNDSNYPLLEGKSLQETTGYLPYVAKRIIDAAKKVVEAGAVRILIPGNFPIGCLPIYLTVYKSPNQEAYDEHGCLKSLNMLARLHNKVLIKAIKALRVAYQHAFFVYADYYNAFMHLLTDAARFDENLLLKSCCVIGGEYNYNASQPCGAPGVPVCQNPAKQRSWDALHLTQEAYKDIAERLITGEYTEPKLI